MYDCGVAKRSRPPRVTHRTRPELGVGEVGEIVTGQPPVLQVYWPEVDKYGYYLATDIVRVGKEDYTPATPTPE